MNSVSPVFSEAFVENERVIALDQPQYHPLIMLPVQYEDGTIGAMVRFRLSDEERAAITAGADILITELVFDQGFTPIHVEVSPQEGPKVHMVIGHN